MDSKSKKNPNPMGTIRKKTVVKDRSKTAFIEEVPINNEADLLFLDDAQIQEIEKQASNWEPYKKGLYGALGTMTATAIMAGAGMAYDKWQQDKQNKRYQMALMQAINYSPALKRYDIALLQSYMPMIIKSSPTVAADPRLLANYLESMLDAEGHLNLSTFRELSGIENTVLNNQAMMHPWRVEMIKGLSKGTGESMGETFGGFGKNMSLGLLYGDTSTRKQEAATTQTGPAKPGDGNVGGK